MNTEDNNDFYDDELSRSLISNDFEEDTPRRKKKSKKNTAGKILRLYLYTLDFREKNFLSFSAVSVYGVICSFFCDIQVNIDITL